MILEGLVTTTSDDGGPHLAPMGPRADIPLTTLLFRPFPTSTTYRNLLAHGEGVFHLTDDVRVIARSAVGRLTEVPATRAAERVNGFVLVDACRAFEFVVRSVDDSTQRINLATEIVKTHELRPFLGFNRAKHAVLEAAILATRMHLIPANEIEAEFRKLRIIVDKTAGPNEDEAMTFLEAYFAEMKLNQPGS